MVPGESPPHPRATGYGTRSYSPSVLLLGANVALGCTSWGAPTELSEIFHEDLAEASGVAASRIADGVVWTHDDSGRAVLFRFALDGTITRHAVPGADNLDWEDIASAPCPGAGECLFVADIGSDRLAPSEVAIYVAREPDSDRDAVLKAVWNLEWPGEPQDAEALLVHPCTGDAWIVTKADVGEVWRVPANAGIRRRPLERVATLAIPYRITGGDFAPQGDAVVLRSDSRIWRLPFDPEDPDAHWSDAPTLVAELDGGRQGEGIAWEADGDLLLVDEGQPTPLGRLVCEDAEVPPVCVPERSCGCSTAAGPFTWGAWLGAWVWSRSRRSAGSRPAAGGSAAA